MESTRTRLMSIAAVLLLIGGALSLSLGLLDTSRTRNVAGGSMALTAVSLLLAARRRRRG